MQDSRAVRQSVLQSTHSESVSQSVDGASVRSYHHHSVFASLQLIYCRRRRHRRRRRRLLVGSPKRPLPSLIPPQFRSHRYPTPPPTKEHDSNFPPKTQIPGRFTSVQETGRSSRSAHWPRNGGGRGERRRPDENGRVGRGGGERRREKQQEAISETGGRRLTTARSLVSTRPTCDSIPKLYIKQHKIEEIC